MPVAEVPGDPQQICVIGGHDFKQRLGGGANADIAAALELETITLDQVMCPGQIKEKGLSRIGDEADAAAVPVEIGKGYRINRGRLRPISSAVNRDRSSHQ